MKKKKIKRFAWAIVIPNRAFGLQADRITKGENEHFYWQYRIFEERSGAIANYSKGWDKIVKVRIEEI